MSSHLDYCNSLFVWCRRHWPHQTAMYSESSLGDKVASIYSQCSTASFPWLPVKFRRLFKMCLLTYTSLHEKQSVYLHSMLTTLLPSHSLRLSKGIILSVPRVKTNTALVAVSLEQPATVCPFSHISCYLQAISGDTSLWLGLTP